MSYNCVNQDCMNQEASLSETFASNLKFICSSCGSKLAEAMIFRNIDKAD